MADLTSEVWFDGFISASISLFCFFVLCVVVGIYSNAGSCLWSTCFFLRAWPRSASMAKRLTQWVATLDVDVDVGRGSEFRWHFVVGILSSSIQRRRRQILRSWGWCPPKEAVFYDGLFSWKRVSCMRWLFWPGLYSKSRHRHRLQWVRHWRLLCCNL